MVLFCSCNITKHDDTRDVTYNTTETIICQKDSNETYIAYIPTYYDTLKTWPFIVCFDPQANGKMPVDSLKYAAEKYGYILIGSNNIRNESTKNRYSLSILLRDIYLRYKLDVNKNYYCGFSGGGRLATSLVNEFFNIKGVISCGAGNQTTTYREGVKAAYIVGNEDFNYNEVLNSVPVLNRDIALLTFNGGHRWPSSSILTTIIEWWELENNNYVEKQLLDKLLKEGRVNLKNNNFLHAAEIYRNGVVFFKDSPLKTKFERASRKARKHKEYREQIILRNQLQEKEIYLQQFYYSAFESKDTTWWKNEIVRLTVKTNKDDKNYEDLMNSRIISFISMISYMHTSQSIALDDMNKMKKYLSIYKYVDKDNPDYLYFTAVFYDKNGNEIKSKEYLQNAVNKGFSIEKKADINLSYDLDVVNNDEY